MGGTQARNCTQTLGLRIVPPWPHGGTKGTRGEKAKNKERRVCKYLSDKTDKGGTTKSGTNKWCMASGLSNTKLMARSYQTYME